VPLALPWAFWRYVPGEADAMKRVFSSLLVVLAITFMFVSTAKAHAVLVSSIPKAGEVLEVAPPEIVLEFSEEIDPSVARIELLDQGGQVLATGPLEIDPGAPHILRLPIEPLPDGTYTAIWRVRSAVDGHITNSSLGFSIGEASSPASLLPPPGTPDPATVFPSMSQTIARWISYLSAALALGSLSFGFFIWRPVYRQVPHEAEQADEGILRLIRWMTLVGLVTLAVATVGFAIVLAAQASEVSVGRALGLPLSQWFVGRIGTVLGVRLALSILLGLFVLWLPAPGTGSSTPWWLALLLGALLALTFSLQGHGAAQGSVLSVIVIWLHLAGTAIWLGGLPMLVAALRQPGVPAAHLVPNYSKAALISVGVLALTGLYNAIIFVGTLEALTETTYGRALIVKTAIFVLLLALGAINLLVLSPRLRKTGGADRRGLTRTVPAEILLGILLLLAVGVLSGVSPAYDALQARREQGIIETASVEGVNILLRVVPGRSGENEIGVEFTDTRPGAEDVAPEVLLRLTARTMDMGIQQIATTSIDGLRYTARGSFFSMVGPWDLEVIIRRPGFNDARHTFEVDIQDSVLP
jgi:copper transport protein